MPSGSGARRVLLLGVFALFALFIAGLITGAIGWAILSGEGEDPPFISDPEVHLPAQTIFPNGARERYLEFLVAEELDDEKYQHLTALFSDDEDAAEKSLDELLPPHRALLVEDVLFLEREAGIGGSENNLSSFLEDLFSLDEKEATERLKSLPDFQKGLLLQQVQLLQSQERQLLDSQDLGAHKELNPIHEIAEEGPFQGGFKFVITNTMLSAWITSLLLILIFVLGVRKARMVPGRLQNLVEIAVESLLGFVDGVIGRDLGRKVFPLIATIFLFVAFNSWIALIPLWPSLGFKDAGGEISAHLLRSAGTDLNMALALALVSFVFVEYWGLRMLGFRYLSKFMPIGEVVRSLRRGQVFQAIIAGFVGFLEGVSELVRIISFTFRLFGNMTAGEVLVLIATFLVPFVATVFVYGLELLVGLVQALIFAGLTLVFVTVAITPHEEEEH